jgi:uncharacterized protein YndB with AHSA1/START domain/DNA-binding transcriptional ArsR family regulator
MKTTTLNALAEPHRLQMIELLREGPLTVGDIAFRLNLRQPQASKHLKILSESGFVEARVEANRRIYRLCPEPLMEIDKWLESFRGMWEEQLDRLSDYLNHLKSQGFPELQGGNVVSNQKQGLLLKREFNAPRELVFKVWTDPEHFGNWWGPKGATLDVVKMDVRPGGVFLGCQKSPDGQHVMWGKYVYQEVQAPEKLVWVQSFSDEEGNIIRAPFNASWPLEILNILTLEEQNGKTLLTLQGGPINASAEEQAAFDAMSPMVGQGFEGTFEKLDNYLASQQ